MAWLSSLSESFRSCVSQDDRLDTVILRCHWEAYSSCAGLTSRLGSEPYGVIASWFHSSKVTSIMWSAYFLQPGRQPEVKWANITNNLPSSTFHHILFVRHVNHGRRGFHTVKINICYLSTGPWDGLLQC